MKIFTARFLRGFLALLPALLSVYILLWLFHLAEDFARHFILFFLPDQVYLPGLGILTSVLLIALFGQILEQPAARRFFLLVEGPFQILPVVRTVYTAIKDFTQYLSPSGQKNRPSRVVAVKLPGTDVEMVGLVTRENTDGLPKSLQKPGYTLVYLPMSYQFGGYTVFVPTERTREVPMSTEQAMRSVLTAWVSGSATSDEAAGGKSQ